MKHYYISSINGPSGICKYSRDFYELVLKDKGYIFIDSRQTTSAILSTISSKDHVHIEIGIFQKREIEILLLMLNANYKSVSITLHDAPLLKYPFYEFKNAFINNVSRFYDKYISGFKSATPYVKKLKSIYVLSRKGVKAVKETYGVDNVYFLRHIVNSAEIKKSTTENNDFIYFGFIGKNKGLEYSLQLHQNLLSKYPDLNFYVVGSPIGKEKIFYTYLKEKYTRNVHYLGYVQEDKLAEIFDKATFALLPFKDYKFFSPLSGSLLYSLKQGKIVLTKKVNSVPEIIQNGKTGLYLSGILKKDTETITNIFNNKPLIETMRAEVHNYITSNHSVETVSKTLLN